MAQKKQRKARRSARPAAAAPSSAGWRAFWDRRSDRTQHLVCLAALLVVAAGFFAPVLFTGLSLAGSDTVQWQAMAEAMIEYEEETGREALWAPNAFAGMPGYMILYAGQIPQVDDIPSLLRPLMWPVAHFLVLLLGSYLLVVLLTRNKLAGVLTACAYGLTTYLPILLVAGHNTKFIALCFAPWLVLAFAYALRRPSLLAGLLFAIALAANLRAGHVQITYYVTFLLGIWWLVEAVGAARHGRLKVLGASTGWMALGSVLGLLMVAQPYLANFEYKAYTIRGAATGGGGLDWSYAMGWSQGVGELLTLAVADIFGGGGATYWGPKTFTSGPHYVGGVVLLLAVLALWRVRRNVVWGFGLGALLMVLFSLGENLPLLNRFMFDYFPLFDAFRVPETWLSMVAFALAVLAGLGLAEVGRADADEAAARQRTKAVYAASGVAVGAMLLLLVFGGSLLSFEKPGEQARLHQAVAAQLELPPDSPRVAQATEQVYQEQIRQPREAQFRSDALRTLVFLVLAGLLLVGHRRGVVPSWTMQAALVLLVVVDLWGVGRRYFSQDDLVRTQQVEDQIPSYDFDQFILSERAAAGGAGQFRVLSLEGNPTQVARPAYFYESLGGYHGAKLRLYQDYLENILFDPQTGLPNPHALDLLNTRYVIARQPLPGLSVVYQSQQTPFVVLENPNAVPRAFFVGETEVVDTPEATWARIRSEAFDPHRTALLPSPIDFETTPLNAESDTSVVLESYSPREIVWQLRTDAPRLLVVSEVFYPAGWEATIDGEEVPIHRADYLLRAVPVPAGEHTLVMRFDPRSHTLGLWISGLSTLAVYGTALALLSLAWYRRRERPQEVPAPEASEA